VSAYAVWFWFGQAVGEPLHGPLRGVGRWSLTLPPLPRRMPVLLPPGVSQLLVPATDFICHIAASDEHCHHLCYRRVDAADAADADAAGGQPLTAAGMAWAQQLVLQALRILPPLPGFADKEQQAWLEMLGALLNVNCVVQEGQEDDDDEAEATPFAQDSGMDGEVLRGRRGVWLSSAPPTLSPPAAAGQSTQQAAAPPTPPPGASGAGCSGQDAAVSEAALLLARLARAAQDEGDTALAAAVVGALTMLCAATAPAPAPAAATEAAPLQLCSAAEHLRVVGVALPLLLDALSAVASGGLARKKGRELADALLCRLRHLLHELRRAHGLRSQAPEGAADTAEEAAEAAAVRALKLPWRAVEVCVELIVGLKACYTALQRTAKQAVQAAAAAGSDPQSLKAELTAAREACKEMRATANDCAGVALELMQPADLAQCCERCVFLQSAGCYTILVMARPAALPPVHSQLLLLPQQAPAFCNIPRLCSLSLSVCLACAAD
jgi:hypothetical protein